MIFIVLFGTWQLSSGPLIDPFFVSSPSEIAGKFYELVIRCRLFSHGGLTVVETLAGFVLGATVGIAVGLLLGRKNYWPSCLNRS